MIKSAYDLLTVEELCAKLQISRNTAYQLLENKKIIGFKVGQIWRIPDESISSYIVSQLEKRGIKNVQ